LFESLNENQDQFDAVLDKINTHGIDSLTDKELSILNGNTDANDSLKDNAYSFKDFDEGFTYHRFNGDKVKINTISDTHISFVVNGKIQDFKKHNSFLNYMNSDSSLDLSEF